MITMDRLPIEVLSLIFDQLSIPEKFNLRLLNRQTNALLSEPRHGLFGIFHLELATVGDPDTPETSSTEYPTHSTLALREIYNSAFRLNVSSLEIDCEVIPGQKNDPEFQEEVFKYAGLSPEASEVLSRLYLLENLASIKLNFPQPVADLGDEWQLPRQKYREDVMTALCTVFEQWGSHNSGKPCPVQKLEIHQLSAESRGPIPCLPNLTHLSLEILMIEGDDVQSVYANSTSAGADLVRRLLEPFCAILVSPTGWLASFPKLEKFALRSAHSYCPIGYEPYIDWDAITIPCLRELDLIDLIICTDAFENFLIRHAATLQHLSLNSPQVLVYDEQADKPNDREYKYGKKWYDIWKNLQDNLSHLIQLDVRLGDGAYCYYTDSDDSYDGWDSGFQCEGNSDFLDQSGTNEPGKDAEALDRFRAVVESRRRERKVRSNY